MKTQGYYILSQPEAGVFGPYEPSELHRIAVAAGHAEHDVEREASDIAHRIEGFKQRARAQVLQAARAAAATLDPGKLRAAAVAIESIDETVAKAVAAEQRRLELNMPILIKPDVVMPFRWSRRGQLKIQLDAEVAAKTETEPADEPA